MSHYSIEGGSAAEIARSIEHGVRDGGLTPGTVLPAIRQLAASLGVSPTTVASAYRDVRSRGLVVGDGRRGTRVTSRPPVAMPVVRPPREATGASRPHPAVAAVRDLASGGPDPALLPDLADGLRGLSGPSRAYTDVGDDEELLALASGQLARGGVSPTDPVAIVGGALDGVERVLAAHLDPGDRIAVEDPGYSSVLDLVGAMRLVPVPCPVDGEGIDPSGLEIAIAAGARAVVVTPRAQNPTGAIVTPRRAAELRSVIDRAGDPILVVEDDHAGQVATPTGDIHLIGTGSRRRAVVCSVSKWLGPDLRVAFVAGDPTTIARVEGRRALGPGWVSHVLQRAAAELWEVAAGGDDPLLSRAAAVYERRRSLLIDELAVRGIRGTGASGLNVWVPVREETPVVEHLRAAGYAVRAGERYRIRSRPAVRVTIAALPEEECGHVADAIAMALEGRSPGRAFSA